MVFSRLRPVAATGLNLGVLDQTLLENTNSRVVDDLIVVAAIFYVIEVKDSSLNLGALDEHVIPQIVG